MMSGVEVIVGAKRDPQFGPVIMFGIGGVLVDVIRDVSLRIAPLTRRDALEMMHSLKASAILEGVRGSKPVNFNKLADIIVNVSRLMMKERKIKEIDLNPVIVSGRTAIVVDVRVIQ